MTRYCIIGAGLGMLAVVAMAAAGCGPKSSSSTIPALPGDGNANTAEPPASVDKPTDNPWANRDDLVEAPPIKEPSPLALPPIERFTLKNGLPVVVVKSDKLPLVGMQLAIKAGDAESARDKMGIASFAAMMLSKGTRARDALKIAETIDSVGGSLAASADYESTVVSCSALANDLGTCLALLPDVTVNPTFPDKEMDEVRRQLLAVVRQRTDDAGQLADAHLLNLLWGDQHPRGWPMSARTIGAIQRADLAAWHKSWFKPQNAVLMVVGAVETRTLRPSLERAFATWRPGKLPARPALQEPAPTSARIRLVDKPGQTQSHIRIGQPGIAHNDPAYFDVVVMNYVLGGGAFSSRLMKVVRSQEGKTYGASTTFDQDLTRGSYVATTFTRNAEAVATTQLVLQEIAKMKEQGPTESEVKDAITNRAGSYAIRYQTASDIADAVLTAQLHGLGDEFVRTYPLEVAKVTPESAKQAAERVLAPQTLALVIVGDAKDLEPQLQKARWPYEKVGHLEPVAGYEREAEKLGPVDPKAEKAGRELLDKALAAKGGAARMAKLTSLTITAKGKIIVGPQELPAELVRRYQAPDRLRMDITFAMGGAKAEVVTVLSGDKAWNKQPQTGLQELPPAAVVELRKQIWRDQEFVLVRHKEPGVQVAAMGEQTVDGKKLLAVRIAQPSTGTAMIVYLDPRTYLPARMTYSDGGVESVETYADYKAVDGIQIAHSRRTESPDATLEVEVEDALLNATLDPSLFSKPE